MANDSVTIAPVSNWFGTDSFMVVVTDPTSLTDTTYQVVVVNNINDAPVITSTAVTNATEDVLYEYQVVATDDDVGDAKHHVGYDGLYEQQSDAHNDAHDDADDARDDAKDDEGNDARDDGEK